MKPEETWFMVIFVTLCSVICFLEIKRYQTLIVLKGVTYVVFVICCTVVSMYLYCTQSQFLCDFQCDYFATGANIVCFDSGTRDMICMLLALIIWFFNISIKHYTPTYRHTISNIHYTPTYRHTVSNIQITSGISKFLFDHIFFITGTKDTSFRFDIWIYAYNPWIMHTSKFHTK